MLFKASAASTNYNKHDGVLDLKIEVQLWTLQCAAPNRTCPTLQAVAYLLQRRLFATAASSSSELLLSEDDWLPCYANHDSSNTHFQARAGMRKPAHHMTGQHATHLLYPACHGIVGILPELGIPVPALVCSNL